MARKTLGQERQYRHWLALGTVKGFHGWLNNLEAVVKYTGVVAPVLFQTIGRLHLELGYVEEAIRAKMRGASDE